MGVGVPVELVVAGTGSLCSGVDRGADGATDWARAGASRVGDDFVAAGGVACLPVSPRQLD